MVEGSYDGHDFMSDLTQRINDIIDAQMKLQALVGEQDTAKEVETADAAVERAKAKIDAANGTDDTGS